jgi:hypothetical protein
VDIPKTKRVADLTVEELLSLWDDQLRVVVRENLAQMVKNAPTLPTFEYLADASFDDFPVDDVGPWPEGMSLRREDMYDDDGR